MISKLHEEIILDIKQYFTEESLSPMLDYTNEELCHMLFKDLRKRNGVYRGLRLTDFGKTILGAIYTQYDFNLKLGDKSTNNIIISLHKHMTSPYYLNAHFKTTLIVFDGDLAMWMRLYNNDISKFLEMISSKEKQ